MMDKNILATFFTDFSGKHPHSITRIQGDASTRQYFRVTDTDNSAIVCYDPEFAGRSVDSYPFLVVHELFVRHDVAVPEVKSVDAEHGLLLLEDCGDLLLQNLFAAPDAHTVPARYRAVIDILVQIQAVRGDTDTLPFSLSFDHQKLMFEFDFFIEHALNGYFKGVLGQRQISALRRVFEEITDILVQPCHFVLNHRDFHSRNIMIFQDSPVIIDFQDARMGLPQYDAVSLIRDSYVRLDDGLTEELKAYHYHALRSRDLSVMSFDEYLYYFDIMAFQRNIKAIGTFAYQTIVKKNNAFEHSIAPTLAYLPDYINARSELRTAGKILQPLLDGVVS